MSEIEHYLRGATRGLWGRERQALRAELLGHVQQRVQELRVSGLDQREAERQTLRELGAPAQVARGMAGVYALPTLTRTGLALAVAATLLLGALPQGLAQVQSIFGNVSGAGASPFLDLAQLKTELSKAGGRLDNVGGRLTVSLPGTPASKGEAPTTGRLNATLVQNGRTFIATDIVLNAFMSTRADLRLSGWDAPTLQVGRFQLPIQTGSDRRLANAMYGATLQGQTTDSRLMTDAPLRVLEPNGGTLDATFSGTFQPGQVYALVTPSFNDWYVQQADLGATIKTGNTMLTMKEGCTCAATTTCPT